VISGQFSECETEDPTLCPLCKSFIARARHAAL